MPDVAPVTISIKSTADLSGLQAAARALDSFQKGAARAGDEWQRMGTRLTRKFSMADAGRDLANMLGIGSSMAIAATLSGLIIKHFKDAAEAAKEIADQSERTLEAVKKTIELRQNPEQQLATQRKEYARLVEEREKLLNPPKERVPISTPHAVMGIGDVAPPEYREVTRGLTGDEEKRAAVLATQIQALSNDIEEAQRKITATTSEEAAKRETAYIDEGSKIEEAQKRRAQTYTDAAAKYRELADPQLKYKQQLAEIDALTRTFTADGVPFLSQQDAAAAKARVLAEMNDVAGKAIRGAREEIERYEAALELLNKNPELSDQEKQARRAELLQQQAAAIKAMVAALTQFEAQHPGIDVGAMTSAIQEFTNKGAKIAGELQPRQTLQQRDQVAARDLSDPSKHYQSSAAAEQGAASGFLVSLGTKADSVADSIRGGLNSALQNTSDLLYNIISGSMSFGRAWITAITQVSQQFLRMITDMVAKMIWRATIERGLTALGVALHIGGEATKTAATATGSGIRLGFTIKEALASVIHGAVEAFEALASIPYVGPVLAVAAMAAALYGGYSLISKIGHAQGGLISGPGGPTGDQVPAMLSSGEFVARAAAVDRFGPDFFHALNAGVLDLAALPGNVARQAMGPAAAAASPAAAAAGARSSDGRPLSIALLDSRDDGAYERFIRDPRSEGYVLGVMRKNRRLFNVKV